MRRLKHSTHLALAGALLMAAFSAAAQAPGEERPPAVDLREELVRIAVTVKDLYGRQETRQIPLTIYRPPGTGPFPLVIFNHGRAATEQRARQGRSRPKLFARYMVSKGFVVIVSTRVGFAETYGDFDPESSGPCNATRPHVMSIAASDQVLAALEHARSMADVDTTRWLVAGASVGGATSIATVWRNPPGLVGGINFAGGASGDPDKRPGEPCSPQQLTRLWASTAALARAPMLWLYWENDRYWGAEYPKTWHQAWVGQGANAEFHQLSAVGKDGHAGFTVDMDRWVPIVERFLHSLGFEQPGQPQRPPATAFAAAGDIDKVPLPERARNMYPAFLLAKLPRAFAIGARGAAAWASGDWAMAKALGNCQRRGDRCRLYAVDDDVVWPTDP